MSHNQVNIVNFQNGDVVPSAIIGPKTTVIQKTALTKTLIDSLTPVTLPDMTMVGRTGHFLVSFNGQFTIKDTSSITASSEVDLIALYAELTGLTATVTNHAAVYGSETLGPGVYHQPAASSIAGNLTLDAGGNANALFVFRCVGAFATGASTEIILTNGATSNNVWFVSGGASSTGASTIMRGNLLANQAAASTGASTQMEGRLMTVNGAVGIGATSTFTTPTGTSVSDLGSFLNDFSIFAGAGSISNTGASVISGNIGTDFGSITGFETATVNGIMYPGALASLGKVYWGIYINGTLAPHTQRSATRSYLAIGTEFPMILSSMISVTAGQIISIRAYATIGEVLVEQSKTLVIEPIANVAFL
jgi:hypothetical protein